MSRAGGTTKTSVLLPILKSTYFRRKDKKQELYCMHNKTHVTVRCPGHDWLEGPCVLMCYFQHSFCLYFLLFVWQFYTSIQYILAIITPPSCWIPLPRSPSYFHIFYSVWPSEFNYFLPDSGWKVIKQSKGNSSETVPQDNDTPSPTT